MIDREEARQIMQDEFYSDSDEEDWDDREIVEDRVLIDDFAMTFKQVIGRR
jgi:hypothetical protein